MLTFKTILGAGWSVSSRLTGRLIDFVTLLVLARILSPADFGLTALAATLIVIADTVLEVPLSQALTRLRVIDKPHLDTAFTLGLLRGLLFSLVVLAAAWPFSQFYSDPRLFWVIAALGVGPAARGLYSPGMVEFTRRLSFREVFVTQLIGKLVAACLAVLVLYLGGGFWAIVVNSVVSNVGATLLSYLLAPYRPALSLTQFRDFSGFMGWFSSTQLIAALTWQFDRILLGKFTTSAELGRFSMASDIAVLPTQSLIGPAMQPVMSAFASINDDRDRLKSAYLKATHFTMMLALPACLFMSIAADLLIHVLLGEAWASTAPYLQWLALTALPTAYNQPLYSLSLAVGRPKSMFLMSLIDFLLRIVVVPLGLYFFAIWGVIGARGLIAAIMLVVAILFARAIAGVTAASQLANLWQIVAACLTTTALVLLVRFYVDPMHLSPFIELGVLGVLGAGAYLGSLFLFGIRPPALPGIRR